MERRAFPLGTAVRGHAVNLADDFEERALSTDTPEWRRAS